MEWTGASWKMICIMTDIDLNFPHDAEPQHSYGHVEFRWSGFNRRCIMIKHVHLHAPRGTTPARKNKTTRPFYMSRRNSCLKSHFLPQYRQSSCLALAKSTSVPPRWNRSQPPSMSSRFRASRNTDQRLGQALQPAPSAHSHVDVIWCRLDAVQSCDLSFSQNQWSSSCACATLVRKRRGCSCVVSMPEGQAFTHTFAEHDNRRYVCPNLLFLQLLAQSSHWGHVRNTNLHPSLHLHRSWSSRFRPKADLAIAGQALPAPACAVVYGAGLQRFGGRPC